MSEDRVTIIVHAYAWRPSATGQSQPMVGIAIGGETALLSFAECDAVVAAMAQARRDATAKVAVINTAPALAWATPEGRA